MAVNRWQAIKAEQQRRQLRQLAAENEEVNKSLPFFTEDVVKKIPLWVLQGYSKTAIAEKIGCTEGSLAVTCCRLKISLERPPDASIVSAVQSGKIAPLVLLLPGSIDAILVERARLYGKTKDELAQELLIAVVTDDLFKAVLVDERGEPLPHKA